MVRSLTLAGDGVVRVDWKPDYLRVADMIREGIRAGEWEPGDQLPSISELSAIMGVSPTTVKNGLRELKRAGLLYGRPGRGFVAPQKDAGGGGMSPPPPVSGASTGSAGRASYRLGPARRPWTGCESRIQI